MGPGWLAGPADWRSSAGPANQLSIFLDNFSGVLMGRLRSFLRRFVQPAAMVGVVGLLSLSLIVTTPSTAQALTPKLPVAPTFVMGAVKTVAPVAMAAVSVTPVGWGLRLYQLGMLAFSTSDMWMPFVTGTFGGAQADREADVGQGYRILPGFRLTGHTVTQPRNYTVSWTYTAGGSQKTANISTSFDCEQVATGGAVAVGVIYTKTSTMTLGVSGAAYAGTQSSSSGCDTGSKIVGGRFGPSTSATVVNGPENILTFGHRLTTEGFNPLGNDVLYRGSSECIDSAGNISWVTGPDVPGDNGAMLMPSCEKAGKGHGTGRTKVEAFKPDGTQETVWDTGPAPLSDPATPLCDPGRATSGCVLEVTKDGQPCKSGDVECENWSEESQQEGNTRYGCKLGPYTLPLSACSLLEQAYRPGGSPANDENTDGNPATGSNQGPDGAPVTAPAPAVVGTTPGTGTGTSPVPGGSGQTGPSSDAGARQCFPGGWAAFNPVEWVLKPLRCAFEPTTNVQDLVTRLGIRSQTKAPISFLTLEMIGPGGGACPNWTINVAGLSENVVCDSSFTAAILSVRAPLFGIISCAMVWPLIRSLWYAAIPILRVAPTGGK